MLGNEALSGFPVPIVFGVKMARQASWEHSTPPPLKALYANIPGIKVFLPVTVMMQRDALNRLSVTKKIQ